MKNNKFILLSRTPQERADMIKEKWNDFDLRPNTSIIKLEMKACWDEMVKITKEHPEIKIENLKTYCMS